MNIHSETISHSYDKDNSDLILDLRFNGKLSPKINQIFNRISYQNRSEFNDMVTVLSQPHKDNLDWWAQGPASRNTFSSPFFHYYCSIVLILNLIEDKLFIPKEIIVDSSKLKAIITNILDDFGIKHCKVRKYIDYNTFIKKRLKRYFSSPVLFLRKAVQLTIARITQTPQTTIFFSNPVTLIDTFVSPGYEKIDRWYGCLWDNLSPKRRAETYFVPTFVNIPLRAWYSIYVSLRSNPRNYILKEDYLNFRDLLYSFNHKKRLKKLIIDPYYVSGYDISGLVREEFENNTDFLTVIDSLLTYRFIKHFSESRNKVSLAIDWFEGQVIDKAWNMAFKTYYPKVKTIGYRPFGPFPFYLCSYPIQIEKESGVIPDTIAVYGKGLTSNIQEFLPELDVIVVPSLRTQHVWEWDLNFQKPEDGTKKINVLITLPESIHSTLRIVKELFELNNQNSSVLDSTNCIFKLHPNCSVNKEFKKLRSLVSDKFMFSEEKSFAILLKKTDLLITEASGSSLEALACGIPVIIMESSYGLNHSLIPESIPKSLYQKTKTTRQLGDALKNFIHLPLEIREKHRLMSKQIREDYFEPVSQKGFDRLMNINQNINKFSND
jgi:glycosyltransferase involved in cell wall biosynthesis